MKTNFTKRLLDASRQVLLLCAMISAIGVVDMTAQTCTTKSNTTLPIDCELELDADDLVTGTTGNVFYMVTLEQAATGVTNPVDPVITADGSSVEISTPGTYKYQITDASGCWGTFNIEDKSGPICSNDGIGDDATGDCYFADGDMCANGPLVSTCGTAVHMPNNADNYLVDRVLVRKVNDPSARLTDDWAVLEANDFKDCTGIDGAPWSVDTEYKDCDLAETVEAELAAFIAEKLGVPLYSAEQALALAALNPIASPTEEGGMDMPWELCSVSAKSWYAKDGAGNVSEQAVECTQVMLVYRPTFNHINVMGYEEASCSDDLTDIGGPFFYDCTIGTTVGSKVYLTDLDHSDSKYVTSKKEGEQSPSCGKGYKQLIEWSVVDWCDPKNNVLEETQVIHVKDEILPVISAAGDVVYNASPFECSGSLSISAATATDMCSDADDLDWRTLISYTNPDAHGGTSSVVNKSSNTNGASFDNVPIGTTVTISWIAIDECGNESIATTTTIETKDNRAPVAICNDVLNVTLIPTGDGAKARVYAEDIDDSSQDNCAIDSMQVSLSGRDDDYHDYVEFDCDDASALQAVYLRVKDVAGNTNVCWGEINLEDKIRPIVNAPADISITCIEEVPAAATLVDESGSCSTVTITLLEDDKSTVVCGEGTIVRSWAIEKLNANNHIGVYRDTVRQNISITNVQFTWTMMFPEDETITCTSDASPDIPEREELEDIVVDQAGCEDWLLEDVADKYFYGSDGTSCYKIVRTYTLVNWCELDRDGNNVGIPGVTIDYDDLDDDGKLIYDGVGVTTKVSSSLASSVATAGKVTYTQFIKVVDNSNPTVSLTAVAACDTASIDCNGGAISGIVTPLDNCSDATISSIKLTNGDGALVETISNPSTTSYTFDSIPAGTYIVSATVVDACGNVGTTTEEVEVKGDCKKPTPYGYMTAAPVMENCELELWLSDLITEAKDNCDEAPEMAMELLSDVDNSQQFDGPDVNSALFTNPDTDYEDYQAVTITEAGNNGIALWARDASGNTQYVIVIFNAQDNNPCVPVIEGAAAAIAGKITNEKDEDIDQVMVKVQTSAQSPIEQLFSGVFNFSVPMSADVTITPEKDNGYMNGVTTADLVKLQRHILGISTLSSAYQMIAADVNSDDKVTTGDMTHISRLILGLYDELPNSPSWKFVSKDHQFDNPASPWGFPQAINYAELESDVQADFVGVKMGDLTGNASPATNLLGSDNTIIGEMTIAMDETTLTPGQPTVVDFKASDFTDFAGYQFTISLGQNVKLAQVTPGVLPNMTEEGNFGLSRLAQGTITTTWSNANGITLEDGEVLFSLTLESAETVNLSDVISINSKQTVAEAYNNDLDAHTIAVQFNRTEDAAFQLFQNQPNPFNGETMIGFTMPKSGVATLKVMNVAGQVLTTQSAEFVKGYNQIALSKSELNTSGVLYYQIETENHSATKKMVILE